LVECRLHDAALEIIEKNILLAQQGGHRQVESNCHALLAQVHLQGLDLKQAQVELEHARYLFDQSFTFDNRLMENLELVLKGLQTRSPAVFDELRARAHKTFDWTTLRAVDFYALQIAF